MTTKTRAPRFNHVAMSVPADLLDADGRAALLKFYGDVLGWEELPTETLDGQRLVLRAYSNEQFVFLIADPDEAPMTCPRLDHFGMSVDTMEELDEMLERARAFQAQDDRVDIVDKHATDHDGFLVLTSFYVRYLLPLMVEVQHYAWAGAADAPAT